MTTRAAARSLITWLVQAVIKHLTPWAAGYPPFSMSKFVTLPAMSLYPMSTNSLRPKGRSQPKIAVVREQYDTPAHLQRVLTTYGGLNLYGEPRFRLIWGWKRLDWIGGEWLDYDAHGNVIGTKFELRYEPKYPQWNRWHIEKWLPAELYGSPALWYAQTTEIQDGQSLPCLGPFPSRGDYELSWTLEINGEYAHPTESIMREYAYRLMRSEQFRLWDRLVNKRAREKREEQQADARRHDAFSEKDLLFTNPDSGKKSYIVKPV